MVEAQQMPPTSGFDHHRDGFMHVTRHYLDRHQPIGDPVLAVNVPDEESFGQLTEVSAVAS